MRDFVLAALPWVCAGLALALLCATQGSAAIAEKEGECDNTCALEGMLVGMALAVAFGAEYLSYGMLVGVCVGMCFKRKRA